MIKDPLLTRYWMELDTSEDSPYDRTTIRYYGVTAYSLEDALDILKMTQLCYTWPDPTPWIKTVTENIDIRTLDKGHIRPNMNPPIWRGIWFPASGLVTEKICKANFYYC